VTLIFGLLFVLDYVDIIVRINRVRVAFDHLQLLSQRSPHTRYVLAFAYEELGQNDLASVYEYGDNDTNLRLDYQRRVYSNDQDLTENLENTFAA